MDALKREIGSRIRHLRESTPTSKKTQGTDRRRSRSLTIQELADHAQLSADYVGKLELGKLNPTIESLARIAAALETDLNDLLIDLDVKESPKHQAIEELRRFAAQFKEADIRRMTKILRTVMLEK